MESAPKDKKDKITPKVFKQILKKTYKILVEKAENEGNDVNSSDLWKKVFQKKQIVSAGDPKGPLDQTIVNKKGEEVENKDYQKMIEYARNPEKAVAPAEVWDYKEIRRLPDRSRDKPLFVPASRLDLMYNLANKI